MCNSAVYLTLRIASCARDFAFRGGEAKIREDIRTPQRQPFTQNGGAEWEAFLLSVAYAFVFIGLLHNNHRVRQRAGGNNVVGSGDDDAVDDESCSAHTFPPRPVCTSEQDHEFLGDGNVFVSSFSLSLRCACVRPM